MASVDYKQVKVELDSDHLPNTQYGTDCYLGTPKSLNTSAMRHRPMLLPTFVATKILGNSY